MAGLSSSWPLCLRHGRLDRPSPTGHLSPCCRHGRLDRPSPAGRDAAPSLSRRKRGRPGRWTSQLLLLRPRPSAWPVTSSNKLRPAASGVTAPSPGPRALPFPPIRSGISAPPPSWPTRPAISAARPSFSALFAGLAVNFSRQAVIFAHFCWLDGCHGRPRPAICRPAPVMATLLSSWPA